MNLLGDGVLWAAAGSLLLALAGGTLLTCWHWRNRWLDAAKNLVVICLASGLVVVAAALYENRQNAWYPTLADVFGGPGSVAATQMGARSASRTFGHVTLQTTDDRTLPALPSPGSREQTYQVPTSVGRQTWTVRVVLPQGYFDPANAHRAYPVLVLAHGVPGSTDVWTQRMSITRITDPLVSQHKVAPFIAIAPEVTPKALDTECVLGPDGNTQMETWLTKDVPSYLRARLRTINQREAWAWAGYSAGGWCAAMMPLLHPDEFSAGISLGGYTEPWWGAVKPTWPMNSPEEKGLDLVAVAHDRRPRVALFLQTAKDDPDSWPTTRRFLAKVEAPTYVTAQIHPSGGHSFLLWDPGLANGVAWLGRTVPGFHP